jgi:hypothetical protein
MASSKKTKCKKPGTPPSQRRDCRPAPPLAGLGFPLQATVVLDLPRIEGIWRGWYEAGITDRSWSLEVYLELLRGFIGQGLIDWNGMEYMKPTVLAVLEQVRTGVLTLEEFQARLDWWSASAGRSRVPGPLGMTAVAGDHGRIATPPASPMLRSGHFAARESASVKEEKPTWCKTDTVASDIDSPS